MKTAIITVNYKTPWHIKKCVNSVFKHTKDFHYYFVQNSQDEESLKLCSNLQKKYGDQITIIYNDRNLGYVGGINSAYKYAIKHERVCFLNSDCIVTKNWLKEMNTEMDNNVKIVQIAPDMSHYYDEGLLAKFSKKYVSRLNEKLGRSLYSYFLVKKSPRASMQSGFQADTNFYNFCTGACNLVRTKYFTNLGYFLDPNIVHGYGDDFDLTYYLRQFGQIGVTTRSYVIHFVNASLKRLDARQALKNKIMLLNRLYVVHKWNDRLKAEIEKLSTDKIIEIADSQEVAIILKYFGLINSQKGFKDYIASIPAKKFEKEFLG